MERLLQILNTRGILVVLLAVPLHAAVAPVSSVVQVGTPEVVIAAGPGHQEDPNISGNLVAYSDLSGPIPSTVHYYDLSTGTTVEITDPLSDRFDFIPDVDQDRIVFTRVTTTRSAIYLYDVATQTAQELSPGSLDRTSGGIGGNTVVWVEAHYDPASWRFEVAAFDLTNATLTMLSSGPVDINANISPDGNVAVWQSCTDDLWEQCSIMHAICGGSGWNTTALTGTGNNLMAATDGAIVAYVSRRSSESDIYWQPIGGGPEMQLALSDIQQNPSVFDGLIVFESRSNGSDFNIFAYDTITSTLYELTANPFDDFLSDVHIAGDTATVVYTMFNGTDNDVRAVSFNLNRPGSVEQQLIDLRASIAASGNQLTKALDAKLRTAESALATGDTASACTALQDFINHVNAQSGKKIAVADADAWIAAAQQIRLAIGCP